MAKANLDLFGAIFRPFENGLCVAIVGTIGVHSLTVGLLERIQHKLPDNHTKKPSSVETHPLGARYDKHFEAENAG